MSCAEKLGACRWCQDDDAFVCKEPHGWAVHCSTCGAQGPTKLTSGEAKSAWNTRTPTPEAEREGLVEAVEVIRLWMDFGGVSSTYDSGKYLEAKTRAQRLLAEYDAHQKVDAQLGGQSLAPHQGEQPSDVVGLDCTPTGMLGLPAWQYRLRMYSAILGADHQPITQPARNTIRDFLVEIQSALTNHTAPADALLREAAYRDGHSDGVSAGAGRSVADGAEYEDGDWLASDTRAQLAKRDAS